MRANDDDSWESEASAGCEVDSAPPALRLPAVRTAEALVAEQQAHLGAGPSRELTAFTTDGEGAALPVAIRSRLAASATARLGALRAAGVSREGLGKALVELAQDEHREEVAAFESALRSHARAEARHEAGRWSTPRALEERAERLVEGLRNTSEVRGHKLALERRAKDLERAWQLLAVHQRFAEARGRACPMYKHNFVRADGLVESIRRTAHYWVEMQDGRRVGALRHRREGGYRFEPATRMDRRLTAALRERFGWERFYDPDTDAIAISKFVDDWEAAARAAKARAARDDYAGQPAQERSVANRGQSALGFAAIVGDDREVGRGVRLSGERSNVS